MSSALAVGVLGLGEAGSALAGDLAEHGCTVHAWDPAHPRLPEGVQRAESGRDAVTGADVVLSVTSAEAALQAAEGVRPALAPGQLYADLNTGPPALKARIQRVLDGSGVPFADVALLGPVPGHGIRTPALASGPGAERFAELMRPLGMPVEVVGPEPGAAAARKLIRSVFMKGLAASVIECLAAAAAAGVEPWARAEIVRALELPSGALVDRLVTGTQRHAARRAHEMQAAAECLVALGVEPRVARATQALLEAIAERPAPV